MKAEVRRLELVTPTTAATAGAGAGFSLIDTRLLRWLWRVVWSGKYLILACVLIAVVPTFLNLQQTTPLYEASAEILIEGPEATDMLNERGDPRLRISEGTINTEVQVISSAVMAQRVIDKLRLAEDPEFNPRLRKPQPLQQVLAWLNPRRWISALFSSAAPAAKDTLSTQARLEMAEAQVLGQFQSRLSARSQRRAYIIVVDFRSESREKAALIANTVAELYVLDRLEASFENAKRLTGWLGERLEGLRQDVLIAETAVEEYRASHGLRRKDDRQATMTDQQLSELSSRLIIARSELAQKQARLDQLRALVRSNGGLDTASDVLESGLIQRLREQEATLQREMSEAAKTYGDRHPRMVSYSAELNELRQKIASEIQKIASSVQNDVEAANAGVRTLERALDGMRQESNLAGGAEVRMRELERQADASRQLYEAFLARFKRDAEQDGIRRANARVISPAQIPNSPVLPRTGFTLTFVLLLSLGAGLVLVIVLDHLDSAIRSSDEAEEITGLPTVAIVPAQRLEEAQIRSAVIDQPRSPLADAVRSLRVALDMVGTDRAGKVVVLTSSTPREGKTLLSFCLAQICARSGERVLLIDGDVHRPRLHTLAGCDGEVGLTQVLSGTKSAESVLVHGIAPNLDFMPAGRQRDVADLINEQRAIAVLKDVSQRYDRVIIDSAPVLAVADVRIFCKLADKVLYLVRWNHTARDAVRNGLKLLKETQAPLFGIVLSQVDQRKHARYGYGDYGQYYGRYKEYHPNS